MRISFDSTTLWQILYRNWKMVHYIVAIQNFLNSWGSSIWKFGNLTTKRLKNNEDYYCVCEDYQSFLNQNYHNLCWNSVLKHAWRNEMSVSFLVFLLETYVWTFNSGNFNPSVKNAFLFVLFTMVVKNVVPLFSFSSIYFYFCLKKYS